MADMQINWHISHCDKSVIDLYNSMKAKKYGVYAKADYKELITANLEMFKP